MPVDLQKEPVIYVLHGAASSPFVRKTWIFLREKGLDFEHRQLDPLKKTQGFLAMNPLGRIPVLEIGDGRYVNDSSVICDYLEHVHPTPALYPAEPHDRARALWLEEYADTVLVTVCARIYWMHIILPVRTGSPVDPKEVADYQAEAFPPVFDYLDQVAPEGDGIVDDVFGIADIALASPVKLLDLAGAPLDASRWPRFEGYYRRTIGRPSARSIEAEDLIATEAWRTTGNAPT